MTNWILVSAHVMSKLVFLRAISFHTFHLLQIEEAFEKLSWPSTPHFGFIPMGNLGFFCYFLKKNTNSYL